MNAHEKLMAKLKDWMVSPNADAELATVFEEYLAAIEAGNGPLVLEAVEHPVKQSVDIFRTNQTIKYKGQCYRLKEVEDERT